MGPLEEMIGHLEERMAKLDGITEQMNHRLSTLERHTEALRADLNTRFYWLIGVQLTTWVTLMLAILFRR